MCRLSWSFTEFQLWALQTNCTLKNTCFRFVLSDYSEDLHFRLAYSTFMPVCSDYFRRLNSLGPFFSENCQKKVGKEVFPNKRFWKWFEHGFFSRDTFNFLSNIASFRRSPCTVFVKNFQTHWKLQWTKKKKTNEKFFAFISWVFIRSSSYL